MRYFFIVIFLAVAGCSKLQYLDQALALKAYSDEKDSQAEYVKAHDARFDEMLQRSYELDPLSRYKTRTDIVNDFGDPIVCRMQAGVEKCLYRRIVKPMESPRLYFYYNTDGGVIRWERQ